MKNTTIFFLQNSEKNSTVFTFLETSLISGLKEDNLILSSASALNLLRLVFTCIKKTQLHIYTTKKKKDNCSYSLM